jgi:hypothetical protein
LEAVIAPSLQELTKRRSKISYFVLQLMNRVTQYGL